MKTQSNREFQEVMKTRTKKFAVRIIKLADALPSKKVCWDLGRQLLRSGTSVGANYRAACRARSNAEFRAKLGIVEEEADETLYWMELLIESGLVKASRLEPLMTEADEILRIVVSAIKSTDDSDKSKRTMKKSF
ncbi:MAG: four helix bundle protein [Prosthecobacter sp.]|nr:four helix bundle protein [Prosthecobacter sp.]